VENFLEVLAFARRMAAKIVFDGLSHGGLFRVLGSHALETDEHARSNGNQGD
jgi:hypothetical protein